MGRHALKLADDTWLDLLKQMNDKTTLDSRVGLPVPAKMFIGEDSWIPVKRHARQSASSRALWQLWSSAWLLLGDLAEAVATTRLTFLNPRPWWARRKRPHDDVLVIARHATYGRITDAARTLLRCLQHVATRVTLDDVTAAVTRHVLVLLLLLALTRPAAPDLTCTEEPHALVQHRKDFVDRLVRMSFARRVRAQE